jgi:hypothetical protein
MKSIGLGDTVKKVLEKVGFESCQSCENRRQWLNKTFPYLTPNPKRGELTERQKEIWDALDVRSKTKLNQEEMDLIQHIYCEVFHVKIEPCRDCGGSGWLALIDRIENVYKNHSNK